MRDIYLKADSEEELLDALEDAGLTTVEGGQRVPITSGPEHALHVVGLVHDRSEPDEAGDVEFTAREGFYANLRLLSEETELHSALAPLEVSEPAAPHPRWA